MPFSLSAAATSTAASRNSGRPEPPEFHFYVAHPSQTMLRGASAAALVVLLDERTNLLRSIRPWEEGSSLGWDLELPIQDVAVSPDGTDTVVVVGGRILRIP